MPPDAPTEPIEGEVPWFLDQAHRFTYGLIALLALALAMGVGARPAYRALKRHRAIKHVDIGEKALATTTPTNAAPAVKLALRLAPTEPAVLRFAARYCSAVGHPSAANYWDLYLATPNPSPAERLEAGRAFANLAQLPAARRSLDRLLAAAPGDREWRLLDLDAQLAVANQGAALATARALTDRFPGDPPCELRLGRLLLRQPQKEQQAEGRRRLWSVALTPSAVQADAVWALAMRPDLNRGEALALRRTFPQETNGWHSGLGARLLLEVKIDPEQRTARIHDAQAALQDRWDLKEQSRLAEALAHLEAHEALLEVVPESATRLSFSLGHWRAGALVDLRRWEDLLALVTDPEFAVPSWYRLALTAVLADARGSDTDAERHFREAMAACGPDAPCAGDVARLALACRRPQTALKAMEAALRNPDFVITHQALLARIAAQVGDAELLLPFLQRLAELFPEEPRIRIDFAYAALLLQPRHAQAREIAIQLATTHPDDPLYAVTLALALLRNGQATAALEVLDRARVDANAVSTRWRAVRVAALGAAGRQHEARELAATLNPTKLLRQEAELLRPWVEPTTGN